MRKKLNKLSEVGLGLTKAGMVTGVGASIVEDFGGNAGGLAKLSKAAPAIGNLAGAGITIDLMKGLMPRRRRK